ncbi:type VI secretion system tip protein VgrG, partial [Celerinatantimonas yamalensis]
HLTVARHQFSHIKGDEHNRVDGESRVHVRGMQTQYVEQSLHLKTDASLLDQTSREIHLNGGIKITLEAGAAITLKAGGSFITIDSTGISASGPKVKLNSGGSASNGSGYAGHIAKLPGDVEAPQSLTKQQYQATPASLYQQVLADIKTGTPITITCQKRADGTCPLSNCPCRNDA